MTERNMDLAAAEELLQHSERHNEARAEIKAGSNWTNFSECRDSDPAIFSPQGSGQALELRIEIAKSICRRCVVKADCLEYALESNVQDGVWGGLGLAEIQSFRPKWLRIKGLSQP